MILKIKVNLPSVIGKGYASFWKTKKRYRVVKGGRASKKSKTTALFFIYMLMKIKFSNLVVVRKTMATNKDSTFADLKWAARRLGVYDQWTFKVSPLEAIYKPTGQKILFRGFDDPLKLTSLAVEIGYLCWAWFEEAYEVTDEEAFKTFDEGIRGRLPLMAKKNIRDEIIAGKLYDEPIGDEWKDLPEQYYACINELGEEEIYDRSDFKEYLWKQITITYNPWVNNHWTKVRFWDKEDPLAFRLTTTHKCNEFLDQADHDKIEDLEFTDPDRYLVVGLGEYGIPGKAHFGEFRKSIHVIDPFIIPDEWRRFTTTDYGLDMLATLWIAVDYEGNSYVYKEVYKPNLMISEAAEKMVSVNNHDEIYFKYGPNDLLKRSTESMKTIWERFSENGWTFTKTSNKRAVGALAIKEWLRIYETSDEDGNIIKTSRMKFFSNCTNVIRCLPQLQTDEKDPNKYAIEPHEITHAPDALRYYCVMHESPPPRPIAPTIFESFSGRRKKRTDNLVVTGLN